MARVGWNIEPGRTTTSDRPEVALVGRLVAAGEHRIAIRLAETVEASGALNGPASASGARE